MSIEPWQTLTTELALDSRWMRVRLDSARTPRDVHVAEYYYVDGGHFTMAFAVTDARDVLWVRQYKYPVRRVTLELPAGALDPDDDSPLQGAQRELREETGYGGGEWTLLGQFYQSTGKANTVMHAYLATGVQLQGEQQPDPSEEIEVVRVPLAGVLPLLTSGEVVDVHSHTAGLHALHRLRAL